ncbi:MAG: thiamine pyrophosphate-binding protein [Mycobacterium sp.]|nr:thiamine pyrophosphate-binding protein [Mycobacterium sp.]
MHAGKSTRAGRLVARRLKASGVGTTFTLSGGRLFSICDGCHGEGIRLIDTRHEQTAVRALDGHGEPVSAPAELAARAGTRDFAGGLPAVGNVLTEPRVAYPRRSRVAHAARGPG